MRISSNVFDVLHTLIEAVKVFAGARFTSLDRDVQQDKICFDPSEPYPVKTDGDLRLGVMIGYQSPERVLRQVHLTLDYQLNFTAAFYSYPHWQRHEDAIADGRFDHLWSVAERSDGSYRRYPQAMAYEPGERQQAMACFAQEVFLWLVEGSLPDFPAALRRAGHSYTSVRVHGQ